MLRKEDFEPNMETEDKIPGAQPENPAQSQRFGDFIVKYMQNVQDTMELFPGTSFQAINEIFGVLYVPLENMGELEVIILSRNVIPIWIWKQQGHLGSPGCMIIRISNFGEKGRRWQ